MLALAPHLTQVFPQKKRVISSHKLIPYVELFAVELERAIIHSLTIPWTIVSRAYHADLPFSLKMKFVHQRFNTRAVQQSILMSTISSNILYLKEEHHVEDVSRYSDALLEAAVVNVVLPFLLHLLRLPRLDSNAEYAERIISSMSQSTSIAMVAAAAVGDLPTLEAIVQEGADIDQINSVFGSPLNAAIRGGRSHIVQFLLHHGAVIPDWKLISDANYDLPGWPRNYWPHRGSQVFHHCTAEEECGRQEDQTIALQVIQSPQSGYSNSTAFSLWPYSQALRQAVRNGHKGMVDTLLEAASILPRTDLSELLYKVLREAAYHGNLPILQSALQSGVDINAEESLMGNALDSAAAGGHPSMIRYLLQNGAQLRRFDGTTPDALSKAVANGHFEAVSLLIDAGADVNARGERNGGPMYSALRRGNIAMARFLLQNGLVLPVDEGNELLSYAAAGGMEDVVRFLVLDGGVNVNDPRHGTYPIQEALSTGHYRVARILLSLGARWKRTMWNQRLEEEGDKDCCNCGGVLYEHAAMPPSFEIGGFSHFQTKELNPLAKFKAMIGVEQEPSKV
jgi:ankyrin repeat protein